MKNGIVDFGGEGGSEGRFVARYWRDGLISFGVESSIMKRTNDRGNLAAISAWLIAFSKRCIQR